MNKLQGILVLLPKELRSSRTLSQDIYFVMKLGKECVRFKELSGDIIFELKAEDINSPLEVFMFQRRAPTRGHCIGRRRDLIARASNYIFETPCTYRRNTLAQWQSYEIAFTSGKAYLVFDIEYYPQKPLLPIKDPSDTRKLTDKRESDLNGQNNLDASPAATQSLTRHSTNSEDNGTRKRDAFKIPLISHLMRNSSREKPQRIDNVNTTDTVFYDLQKMGNEQNTFVGYEHASSSTQMVSTAPVNSEEVYKFIKTNQYKPVTNEQLSLDVSPQEYFQSVKNRVKYDQNMNFLSMFSSDNVMLTGYLGAGKWDNKVRSEAFMNWYLRDDTGPIPPPQLPPKCPMGMLWEEYYLINKDLYLHDILK